MSRRHHCRSLTALLGMGFIVLLLGSCAPLSQETSPKGVQAAVLEVQPDLDRAAAVEPISIVRRESTSQVNPFQRDPTPTPLPPVPTEPILLEPPSPDATSIPLEFSTPDPVPVSAWRPPLYQAPWAVSPFDHFYFTRPIAGDEISWPLQDYRYGGIFPDTDIVHTGIDIASDSGTPVLAAAAGKVVWTGYGLFSGSPSPEDPYGLAVAIRHGFGFNDQRVYTIYAHMREVDVALGQWVETGTPLGKVGDTGNTTGPHLHFEVRMGENTFFNTHNPELWLVPPQGWGVLVGRVTDYNGSLLREKKVVVRSLQDDRFWILRTYGPRAVNPDPYYNENLVLSDLPQGLYTVTIDYWGTRFAHEIEILPGQVSYFTFSGRSLYSTALPPPGGQQPFVTPAP